MTLHPDVHRGGPPELICERHFIPGKPKTVCADNPGRRSGASPLRVPRRERSCRGNSRKNNRMLHRKRRSGAPWNVNGLYTNLLLPLPAALSPGYRAAVVQNTFHCLEITAVHLVNSEEFPGVGLRRGAAAGAPGAGRRRISSQGPFGSGSARAARHAGALRVSSAWMPVTRAARANSNAFLKISFPPESVMPPTTDSASRRGPRNRS